MISFFRDHELEYDPTLLVPKGLDESHVTTILDSVHPIIDGTTDFIIGTLETVLRAHAAELELKPGQVFSVLRVALTGRTVAPPLFETMEILGKTQCLERIKRAKTLMENR